MKTRNIFLLSFFFFLLANLVFGAELYTAYSNLWINETFNYSNQFSKNRIVISNQVWGNDASLNYNWSFGNSACGILTETPTNVSNLVDLNGNNLSKAFGFNVNKSNCGFALAQSLSCPPATPCFPPISKKDYTNNYMLSFDYWYNQSRVVSSLTGYRFWIRLNGDMATGLEGNLYYDINYNPDFIIKFMNDSKWHIITGTDNQFRMTINNCTTSTLSTANQLNHLDMVISPNLQTYSVYVNGDCSGCCDVSMDSWQYRTFLCIAGCADREINNVEFKVTQNFASETGMEYFITNIRYGNLSDIAYSPTDTTTDQSPLSNENPFDLATAINNVFKDNKITNGTRYIIGVIILIMAFVIWFMLVRKHIENIPNFVHLVILALIHAILIWATMLPSWTIILTIIFGAIGIGLLSGIKAGS